MDARGARVCPAPSSRSPRPAPLAGFCYRSSVVVMLVGSAILLRASSPGGFRNLPRPRRRGASALSLPSLFHLFCCGAFAAPILTVSLPRPHRIAGLFRPFGAVALVGFLRRERPARRGARPCGSLASLGTAVSLRGFFFGWRLEPRAGVQGVSPLAQACEVCPPAPLLECPPLEDIFCLARGARGSRFLLGACAPAPLAGASDCPLHPYRPDAGSGVFHGIVRGPSPVFFGGMVSENGGEDPTFFVPRKLNLLINAKKIGRYAALFPDHTPR